jgi:CD2 antigen cytoplasmic tail-binding protein 2
MASRKVRFEAAVVDDEDAGPTRNAKKRSALLPDGDDDDEEEEEEEEMDGSDDPFQSGRARSRVKKRSRRHHDDDEDDDDGPTEISKQTSLEVEGIAIEPFHMKNESTDGTGYFDGDTYVFRKAPVEDEPDAWLDQLGQDEAAPASKDGSSTVYDPTKIKAKSIHPARKNMDDLSETDLYAKIHPHLGNDDETIMEAISRYGGLLKAESEKARQIAKLAFDDLTEAASAMMLRGNINIYQMKRSQMMTPLSPRSLIGSTAAASTNNAFASSSSSSSVVQWEYKGSADGQIHGPYTTQKMLSWVQAGYFVGSAAVQVRSIETTQALSSSSPAAVKPADVSIKDDLLSDLMDDDDGEKASPITTDDKQQPTNDEGSSTIWGEWQMSDQVDFEKYLSSSSSS